MRTRHGRWKKARNDNGVEEGREEGRRSHPDSLIILDTTRKVRLASSPGVTRRLSKKTKASAWKTMEKVTPNQRKY